MNRTPRVTSKPLIDWQAQSMSQLFIIARNSAYPAERNAAKAELERRRNATSEMMKEEVKA